jgi:hypothetical protein
MTLIAVVFAVSAKWPGWDRYVIAPRRVEMVNGWRFVMLRSRIM